MVLGELHLDGRHGTCCTGSHRSSTPPVRQPKPLVWMATTYGSEEWMGRYKIFGLDVVFGSSSVLTWRRTDRCKVALKLCNMLCLRRYAHIMPCMRGKLQQKHRNERTLNTSKSGNANLHVLSNTDLALVTCNKNTVVCNRASETSTSLLHIDSPFRY